MITLITGIPGTGKTALAVKMMTEIKDRPIFSMGIRELQVPHQPVPPVSEWTELRPVPEDPSLLQPWFTFPPNSIIFIDEAQNVYRPRASSSKVPDHVAANETHRHTGVDFVILTQAPGLIDANVRKFIKRHIHIRETALGRYKYEWKEIGDPESKTSRDIARRDRYKPPKEVFGLYKSAEVHTKVKVKTPWYVYVFFASLLMLGIVGYRIYYRIQEANGPQKLKELTTSPQTAQGSIASAAIKTPEQYVQQFAPREPGFMHTAPAYDELTKAQTVPEPVGCYESAKTGCKCLTQQGTTYETSEQICRNWLANGTPFEPWKKQGDKATPAPIQDASMPPGGEDFPRRKPHFVDAETLHTGT